MKDEEIIATLHRQEGRAAAMGTLLVALLRTHPDLENVLLQYQSERSAQGSLGIALPVADTVLAEMDGWFSQLEKLILQAQVFQRYNKVTKTP